MTPVLGRVRIADVDRVEALDDLVELARDEVVERVDLVLDQLLAVAAAEVAVDQTPGERLELLARLSEKVADHLMSNLPKVG